MEKTAEVKTAKIPKQIAGTYKLLERLGGGSFGEIFKAKHITTGQEVAVKFVFYEFLNFNQGANFSTSQAVKT